MPKNRRRLLRASGGFVAVLSLAATFAGCSSEPMTLDLRPCAGRPQQSAAREIRVAIVPTTQETAGVLGDRQLRLEGLDALLTAKLESIGGGHYRVVATKPCDAAAEIQPALRIGIEKAYVQLLHDTKTGVVVLKVEQGSAVSFLRGQSTGLNWAGSSGEMAAALADALGHALEQLRPTLDKIATVAPVTQPARSDGR